MVHVDVETGTGKSSSTGQVLNAMNADTGKDVTLGVDNLYVRPSASIFPSLPPKLTFFAL